MLLTIWNWNASAIDTGRRSGFLSFSILLLTFSGWWIASLRTACPTLASVKLLLFVLEDLLLGRRLLRSLNYFKSSIRDAISRCELLNGCFSLVRTLAFSSEIPITFWKTHASASRVRFSLLTPSGSWKSVNVLRFRLLGTINCIMKTLFNISANLLPILTD